MRPPPTNEEALRRRALLLQRALRDLDRRGAEALRRLRGEPEKIRRRVAQLGDPDRPRQLGRRFGFLHPDGAEWFYARWCALECIHLWPAPDLVRLYLEGGDPDLAGSRAPASPLLRPQPAPGSNVGAICAKYCMFCGADYLNAVAANSAAQAAMYAARGAIEQAEKTAIRALAFASVEQAEAEAGAKFGTEERAAAIASVSVRPRQHFSGVAREIYAGENTA